MNKIDMIIIAVTGFFVIRGIFRGLTRELASIVGVIAGFYGAYLFYPRMAGVFPAKIAGSALADMLGFAVIFCGVLAGVHLVAVLIRWALGITMLNWVDRLLGAGFGAAKSALLLGVVFFVITRFVHPEAPVMKASRLYPYVAGTTEVMSSVATYELTDKIRSRMKRLHNTWKNRSK